MTNYDHDADLFRLVGTVVAASQIFETTFVLAAKLAVRQADIQVLEDIEPLSKPRSFKQPVKALLNELSKAQSIDPSVESRVSNLVEGRNRVLHRAFLEFGRPAEMSNKKMESFQNLCSHVATESQALSVIFVDLIITWMKRFPAISPTAREYQEKFKSLAERIRSQSEGVGAAEHRR